jgi:hypothetical protein
MHFSPVSYCTQIRMTAEIFHIIRILRSVFRKFVIEAVMLFICQHVELKALYSLPHMSEECGFFKCNGTL